MKKILFLIALCINFIFMFWISNAEYTWYDKNKIVKKLIVSKLQLNKTDIWKKYISKIDEVSKKLYLLDNIKKQEIISKIQKLEEKAWNNENIKNLLKYFEAKIFLSMTNLKESTTNSEKTQKKEKNKISENTKSEKIIFLDKNKDWEYIKIKYLTKEKFIDLNSMKLTDFSLLWKQIKWKLYNNNVEKIIVRYKNPEYYSWEWEYQLKKYIPWNSIFSYNAFKKYRSLNFWKNTYIFEAYTKTKVSKIELEVNLKEKKIFWDEIIKSYIEYIEKEGFKGKNINKYYIKTKKYDWVHFYGYVLVKNQENPSTPVTLATKIWNTWKVILVTQDSPFCKVMEKYNFPLDYYVWGWCFETNTKFREVK